MIDKAFAELAVVTSIAKKKITNHRVLNEVEGLDKPSLENLCAWIWQRLALRFPSLARVTVRRDSSGQGCVYTGPQ